MGNDFIEMAHDLEVGFTTANMTAIMAGFAKLGEGLHMIAPVLESCGAEKLADDIRRLVQCIESDPNCGPDELQKLETQIMTHITTLLGDATAMIAGFTAGNFCAAGAAMGELLGILLDGL
eukprot:NODE_2335_length_485_cov_456.639908_g1915_i0.p1 GENE.NODE_2335_length_485_cov_456.639908_g1915_i0~~NODE_2335_length_485_cov_456.639908_g1915_i0.p1  ORF type:complete len:134 (-),score=44.90 NODE_2335_length_485_cov_456.639908_g1915_i0:84-446(-)